jgi:hypothetical protein
MRMARGRLCLLQQFQDFAGAGVAIELGLLEDRRAVAENLEATAARWHERDGGLGMLAANLGRQTDGPWFVVSERAVLDRDVHGRVPGMTEV